MADFYTIEQLQDEGIDINQIRQSLKIECFGKSFVRVKDFPMKFRDIALESCQKYVDSGIDSFVVESKFALTVWKEETESLPFQNYFDKTQQTTEALQSEQPEHIPRTPVKKRYSPKYRGQEY